MLTDTEYGKAFVVCGQRVYVVWGLGWGGSRDNVGYHFRLRTLY